MSGAVIDYDAELQLHNEQFRAALEIRAADRVLDIGGVWLGSRAWIVTARRQ